jgi:hypothetical protein
MALTNYTGSTMTGTTTAGACVSTAETTLGTVTLPAGQATNKDGVTRVYAWGAVVDNANAKTLKFYFGGTSQAFVLPANTAYNWFLEAIIADKTNTTQTCVCRVTTGVIAATTVDVFIVSPSENQNAAIVVKTTGTGGASNDITQAALIVEA